MKKIALSGIQVTGNLHLGNYLGSIKNWLTMQEDYDCYFFLANLHSITIEIPAEELRKSTLSTVALYLASGLDQKKVTIFPQSRVYEHAELAWILSCVTPIGWLKRMTQFKDKAGKKQDLANTGLFTYPVLMTADILLYDADVVPVGDDQKQHLEIARDIAGAINRRFNQEILKVPDSLIQGIATRVMSLRDGTNKMSKSDSSEASRINLIDDKDVISQKIKKAKTDNIAEISYDPDNRPEISNLINIYAAITNKKPSEIVSIYQHGGFAKFKSELADVIISELEPINKEYHKLMNDTDYLLKLLEKGTEQARKKANKTCSRIKESFGLI
ncbi:MAG: tryptophan--tRNA ligase [Rickettsiaceae bacterium]|nr:tryptophan--tRNA ligase [Rickettsiaceae bacterium]